MGKNILVISTSMRKGGNSGRLAEAFANGASAAGHRVEKIDLYNKTIGFCRGCFACRKTLRCIIADDAVSIAEQMKAADVLAFSMPVYYYEMPGQMKTLLDRMNPLFPSDYAFRDVYLLSAAADTDEGTDSGAINGLKGWISCFKKARLAGSLFCGGVNAAGEIEGNPVLERAYKMGKAV